MDEKVPPRVPGPALLRDEIILCLILRGSNKDRIRAFAECESGSEMKVISKNLARICQTLTHISETRYHPKCSFVPRIILLRNPKMKSFVDVAAEHANSTVQRRLIHTSDLSIKMNASSSIASSSENIDTRAQSAALLWCSCALSCREISPSALIIPEQVTWRQILNVDKSVNADRVLGCTHLSLLFDKTYDKGLLELRYALWKLRAEEEDETAGGTRVEKIASEFMNRIGITRHFQGDPRARLVAFRAATSISLLKQSALFDSKTDGKEIQDPISECADGTWFIQRSPPPLALEEKKTVAARNVVIAQPVAPRVSQTQKEVQRVHKAGLMLDINQGDFGTGPSPIHIIVPVHSIDDVDGAATWIATSLDTQSVSSRIVAHPVLMHAGAATNRESCRNNMQKMFQKGLETSRREQMSSLTPARVKEQRELYVRVRGFMDPNVCEAAVPKKSQQKYDPVHLTYARDVLRQLESVDYVMIVGVEFHPLRHGWVEAMWRRREPDCGVAWYGRTYSQASRAFSKRLRVESPLHFVSDAHNRSSNLLQVQGRICPNHTAFHLAAFRSGSVIDARILDSDSCLWDTLALLDSCVFNATRKVFDSFDEQKTAVEMVKKQKCISQHQVVSEIQLAVADIALSYAFRPYPATENQSRIPRAFLSPQYVHRNYKPKELLARMRAENLHLTNTLRGNVRIAPSVLNGTRFAWSAEVESFYTLQKHNAHWAHYVRYVTPRKGNLIQCKIQDPLNVSALQNANQSKELENTLLVYYEDATGCSRSALQFGDDIAVENGRVHMQHAADFGAQSQAELLASWAPSANDNVTCAGLMVRVLASSSDGAEYAARAFQREVDNKSTLPIQFSHAGVPFLKTASYFCAWLAAAQETLHYIDLLKKQRQCPTRILMFRSVPLWGSVHIFKYLNAHIGSFHDVGVCDGGLMPFSNGIDFSILGCRPWFLRAAVGWAVSHLNHMDVQSMTPVQGRKKFKEMVHDLSAAVWLWPIPYTYPVWTQTNTNDENKSRSLIHVPFVYRRGTNIMTPFMPCIQYRWRAMFSSDRIRKVSR